MKKHTAIKHEKTLDVLVKRLSKNNKYSSIERDIEYRRRNQIGQVDLLTYKQKYNAYYFWEVKSSYSNKTFNKAKSQYEKYCLAYPKRNVKGIFISPKKVRRLYRQKR